MQVWDYKAIQSIYTYLHVSMYPCMYVCNYTWASSKTPGNWYMYLSGDPGRVPETMEVARLWVEAQNRRHLHKWEPTEIAARSDGVTLIGAHELKTGGTYMNWSHRKWEWAFPGDETSRGAKNDDPYVDWIIGSQRGQNLSVVGQFGASVSGFWGCQRRRT